MNMKKEVPAYALFLIAVMFYGLNYLIGGVIGAGFGTLGLICLVLSIIRFFRERANKRKNNKIETAININTKISLKKIVFPFFNKERNGFLMEKWWFRLFIVFYAIGTVILLGSIWLKLAASSWGWCYDSIYLYPGNGTEFTERFNNCRELWKESFALNLLITFISTTVIHYIIQFIFFKIIINFIVLGNKK